MQKKSGKHFKPAAKTLVAAPQKTKLYFFYAAIAALTFIVFYNALQNGITNWDDNKYLTNNPHINLFKTGKFAEVFSTFFDGNYHPLTLISLAFDYKLGGFDPFWFHFTNVLLHALNSILVFKILYTLIKNKWSALLAALIFAAHTLHVESVTWISERKDVLYSFFFLLAIVQYLAYLETKKNSSYFLALLFFLLSLFSKGQAVAFAITLTLFDVFYNRKLSDKKVIIEKIPFLLLAVLFGVLALKAQAANNYIAEFNFSFVQKIAIASYGFTQYMLKLVAPINLSAFYPYPDMLQYTLPSYFYAFILVPLAYAGVLFYFRKNKIVVVVALLFFAFNLLLVLQVISVGSAIIADRYAYIPSFAFVLLIAYLLNNLLENKKASLNTLVAITSIYILTLGILTHNRNKVWKDSLTLWTDVVSKHQNIPMAYYNLATTQSELGDNPNAIRNFTLALALNPSDADSYHNRGNSYFLTQKFDSAYADFSKAIQLKPQFSDSYNNRGLSLLNLKRYAEAKQDFDTAIQLDANNNLAYTNRGVAQFNLGNKTQACQDWNIAYSKGYAEAASYLEKYCK